MAYKLVFVYLDELVYFGLARKKSSNSLGKRLGLRVPGTDGEYTALASASEEKSGLGDSDANSEEMENRIRKETCDAGHNKS